MQTTRCAFLKILVSPAVTPGLKWLDTAGNCFQRKLFAIKFIAQPDDYVNLINILAGLRNYHFHRLGDFDVNQFFA